MSAPIKKEPSIRNGQNKELEEIKMKTPNFDIKDKVFAITGASGVLCGEMARQIVALRESRYFRFKCQSGRSSKR